MRLARLGRKIDCFVINLHDRTERLAKFQAGAQAEGMWIDAEYTVAV